jgi:predicted alpha/beta-fold hydrolase
VSGPRDQEHNKTRAMEALASVPFQPTRALRGGNRQTIFAPVFRRQRPAALTLERWQTPDDDFLRVHVAEPAAARPIAVLLHGLEGSVRSGYLIGLARRLRERGWGVVAMEHRSCGGEMNRARRMYHLGETTDLALVIERAAARWPGRALCAVGWSAGGNQLAKWLGEQGDAVPDALRAAAIVSAPFDLKVSAPHIDRILRGAYSRNFLRTLIPKALEKERQYPGCMDAQKVRASRTFEAFDTHATAALHGFDDAWHYWGEVACGQYLDGVRRPTLLLSARDDPFNPGETIPDSVARSSPWLHGVFPATGGHVGFVHGAMLRRRYWSEDVIARFFASYVGA